MFFLKKTILNSEVLCCSFRVPAWNHLWSFHLWTLPNCTPRLDQIMTPSTVIPSTWYLISWTLVFCDWSNYKPPPQKWLYGCFLKWWYPTTIGFPAKNDHFAVFLGVSPFKETTIWSLVMLYHEAPEISNRTWLSSCGRKPQDITWSGADSRTHKALYKPLVNIVFVFVLPSFPKISFTEKHTWWICSNVAFNPGFSSNMHTVWLISFGSQSDCAKPSNFRVAPNCLGVDFETFLKAKKRKRRRCGPGLMGFWNSKT